MKQLLRSLKKTNIILIAAALVAAIVIVVFLTSYHIKKVNNDMLISDFSEGISEDIDSFEGIYKEMSEVEKEAKRSALKDWLMALFFGNTKNELKSLDEIKEILASMPSDYAEVATRDDIYVIGFGEPLIGQEVFEKFIVDCRLGKPGHIVISEVNVSLDSIYYFIEYDGNSYHVVEDKTRDGYDEESGYSEGFGKYLKIEDYQAEDGTIMEYGYLTDDISLSYAKIMKFYEEINYSPNPESMRSPEFWQFYICMMKPEYVDGRLEKGNGYTEETIAIYSGFTDMHPFFCESNPIRDYDEDGILDRVYRYYEPISEENGMVSAYMIFGNGNTVTLNKNVWGQSIHTEMIDITGEGEKDICFLEYSEGAEGSRYKLQVFENHGGNYILTRFPNREFEKIEVIKEDSGKISFKCRDIDDSSEYILSYEDGVWKSTQ